MRFNVTVDRDEDGAWIVECPSIPGCVSQGQTKEEALKNIKDAIAACLQVCFCNLMRSASQFLFFNKILFAW
ncbi:MAG: type II toxin-antitoxin system HicB family antitoxin [Nostoc indistinguendum CM1-VF10]|jgi:predicted RNase H-like HicB family nuclease|nr:type II toxin-antitoxin system HicB family antitoxin [Nostoc indistinguendum CM1-VF10]